MGMSQMRTGAGDYFRTSKPHSEKLCIVTCNTMIHVYKYELQKGEIAELRQLTATVLATVFPDIEEEGEAAVLEMFSRVTDSTAELVARWAAVGFTHGVLNTDNLSVAGVTIDYGPFGFLDEYQPGFIPNHSDDMGRYDFQNQVNSA